MKLHKQTNELQQEQEQQWVQHALTNEIAPVQVKYASQQRHEADMVSSVVDRMQGIQQHACHCVHACDPTHSAHSPRQRQEASPTGAENVLRQVDAHDRQHTLEHQHEHYASMFLWFDCTEEDHVHVSGRVGWRSHTNAPRCNGGKSSLQKYVIMESMHSITNDQDCHQLTSFTITSMSKILSNQNESSVSDILHRLLKPFCLTWAHVHCNVMSCQVEVQMLIVGCNNHRVYEES